MAAIPGDTKDYQPAPRAWHHAVPIGDRLYMWGGRTEDFGESSRRKLESVVELYDPHRYLWQQEATTGAPPTGLYAGGCTSDHESLLWYGGYDGKSWSRSLHQLNTTVTTLEWEELHQKSTSQSPMAKSGCGLALFQGNKLGLLGGFGIPTASTQPRSTFMRSTRLTGGSGWTNEFHLFDLQEGVWSFPSTTGSQPPLCTAFTFSAIDSHRGVLFGGYSPGHGRMNAVYIIDVQTMHWTKLDGSGGGPWPVGRVDHAACCLNYGEEHPQLLVSGGLDKDDNALRGLWVLDVEAGTWKELPDSEDVQPRWGHSATAFNFRRGLVEVTMFGGSSKFVPGVDILQQPKVAETTVMQIPIESFENSASSCAELVVKDVTKGRKLREEIEEEILVSSAPAGEGENATKAESKIAELEELRCNRIRDLEQQLHSTQQILHTKEEELQAITTQYRATNDELLHSQRQFSTLQIQHAELQQTVAGYSELLLQTDDEIQETKQQVKGSLRGAEVVAERDFVITNQAQSYSWDEYGFRLHVPEKSLKTGLSETTINVRVSLSGHFQFPADSELVSAVYWVFSPHMFSQPLTVEVQHCAAPSLSSNLSFVRTKCTQKELPYQFKEFEGGVFSQQSFYGSISVNHFSGIAIKRRRSEEVSEDYCAQLYKSREGLYDCRFIFAITRNLEACFSVVNKKYRSSQTRHYVSFTFGFEAKQISLNIDSDGIILDNGWEIFPLFPPTVTKEAADLFSPGNCTRIPQCDLMLQWTRDEKPTVPLKHKIDIHGATKDYFILYMANEPELRRTVSNRLPSMAESATAEKDVLSGSESDTPYSPSNMDMQSEENTLPTANLLNGKNKYQDGERSVPELSDLMNEVAAKIPQKWHEVGIQLGMEYDQLKFLSVSNPPGSQQFASVFTAWKNCMRKDYTWAVLIEVLKTPAVKETRLARDLSKKLIAW